MKIPLLIATGAGAIQGAVILIGLALPVIGIGFGVAARFRKKGPSIAGIVTSGLCLLPSVLVLNLWGLPWGRWSYWGAYIPMVPLALCFIGLALSLQKKPIQSPEPTRFARGSS